MFGWIRVFWSSLTRPHPKVVQDRKVDAASKDSFPASDPPSHSGITGPRD